MQGLKADPFGVSWPWRTVRSPWAKDGPERKGKGALLERASRSGETHNAYTETKCPSRPRAEGDT